MNKDEFFQPTEISMFLANWLHQARQEASFAVPSSLTDHNPFENCKLYIHG